MNKVVRLGVSGSGGFGFAFPAKSADSETALKAACEAAFSAIEAFDDGARRGEPFSRLCELSQTEQSAMIAACATPAATPAGLAEKALLLDRVAKARNPSHSTLETFALSLASDAVALAKSILTGPSPPPPSARAAPRA